MLEKLTPQNAPYLAITVSISISGRVSRPRNRHILSVSDFFYSLINSTKHRAPDDAPNFTRSIGKVMKNFSRQILASFLMTFSLCSSAQLQMNAECLTPEQSKSLYARIARIRESQNLEEVLADARVKQAKRDELSVAAADCAKRLSNLLTEIGARLDECHTTIRNYNNANSMANLASKRVKEEQEIFLRQVQIERSMYPGCR